MAVKGNRLVATHLRIRMWDEYQGVVRMCGAHYMRSARTVVAPRPNTGVLSSRGGASVTELAARQTTVWTDVGYLISELAAAYGMGGLVVEFRWKIVAVAGWTDWGRHFWFHGRILGDCTNT
jgi:hypothetical protein